MQPRPEPPLTTQLKTHTQLCHEQIESHTRLFQADFSLADYRELLMAYLGYLRPLEAAFAARSTHSLWAQEYQERRAAFCPVSALETDLTALGLSTAAIKAVPTCTALPPLHSTPQFLGCGYVLEGSTLGGQLIGRRLQSHFGLTPDNGARYFNGYGPQTGPMWQRFAAKLNHYGETSQTTRNHPRRLQALLTSAATTFQTLDDWLHPSNPA